MPIDTTVATDAAPPHPVDSMPDYCARCVAEHGCGRCDTITEPHTVYRTGDHTLTAVYECRHGHGWTCAWRG